MTIPSSWDPYFTPWMDRADLLRWAPRHYRHHRGQLSLVRHVPGVPDEWEAHRGGPGPRTEGLAPGQAAGVYDRIGWLQDTQLVFEAPALARLTADGRLCEAHYVVEIGCGTGRFARDLLTNVCGLQWRYVGLDVSPRMCRIATARLSRWSTRARVMQVDGTLPLPLPAAGADRVVAAFVVDLLPTEYARQLLADTQRVLAPGGLLCLASLVQGTTRASRAFSSAWSILAQRVPALLGGCRPVVLAELLDPDCWVVHTDTTVTARGFPAGVLVAERQQ